VRATGPGGNPEKTPHSNKIRRGQMILWKQHPIYGRHSVHEFEELYQNDQPAEVLDIPDHDTGIGLLDAFLIVFCFACFLGIIVILVLVA
jgi:hypothetical protein